MQNAIGQDFRAWVSQFERSIRGQNALKSLRDCFSKEADDRPVTLFGDSLRSSVLSSCYAAAKFNPAEDPGVMLRNANKAAREALEDQREAIGKLRKFIERHQYAAAFSLAYATAKLRSEGISIKRPSPHWTELKCMDAILEAWSTHLVERIPYVAIWIHGERNTFGCLKYAKPLDIGKRANLNAPGSKEPDGEPHGNLPSVETMLLFDLVQSFRFRSEGRRRNLVNLDSMPSGGDPQYPLAAAFINATFTQINMTRKGAQNRLEGFLRKHRGSVRYYPWPIARRLLDVTLR